MKIPHKERLNAFRPFSSTVHPSGCELLKKRAPAKLNEFPSAIYDTAQAVCGIKIIGSLSFTNDHITSDCHKNFPVVAAFIFVG